jgi:Chitobiase/beta-hexosaminidase C-terminal domain/FG-GAP-like repeat/FG-GAP repeat
VTGVAVESAPAGNVEFRDTSNGNAVLATAALGSGTSSSTWVNTQNPATLPQPLSIVVGDFNGDGIPDIAIGTNGSTTGYLGILLGNGNGTFQAAKNFTGLPNNQAIVAANFVNGGPLDILTVDNNTSGTNNAALFIGNGEGGGTLQTPFGLGGIANVTAVAAADFNRDGNEDFVITGVIYGVYCFAPVLGNGKGTFGGPTLNAIGNNPLAVAVGPFNTNGYPDIVVADSGADQVTIFQNNSQGYFFPEGQANTGTKPVAMVTGDFNGDGFLDLAIVNNSSNNVTILLGHGNETLTAGSTLPTGHAPTSIAVGDFNGDGIADLAVVNSGDRTVTILQGKGDGTFGTGSTVATGINPVNIGTGDFSGTGQTDLVVTNQDIASTTGSTLTVQAAELTQMASATTTKVAPAGSGSHLVDADYVGDSLYNTSTSTTTSLTSTTLPTVATPVLSPTGGTYASAQKVTITDATQGAVIYYTTNGTTPTTASTKYTGAIPVSASETIHAIAVETGYNNNGMASASYAIEAAPPAFSPAAGTYTSAQSVKITSSTTGATIYYTTNGATPTIASTKYTAVIAVSASETIKAIAVASGFTTSAIATAAYVIEKPAATPVLSPTAGAYTSVQSIKITSATTSATIYYTTNGTTPTTASTRYTAAISVTASETIKAIAVATGSTTSAVATAAYVIEKPALTPVLSPMAGTYTAAQSVKITDATTGATIYYTTNGTTPTTASTKYTGAIAVSASETIKAIAVASGYTISTVATAAYVIEKPAATPVLSPAAGTYTSAQSVKITSATTGATIYYTTNGTTPTTASTKYTAAIAVSASETIKAIAVASGYTISAVATAAYVIEKPAVTPVFSPVAGTYTSAQSVKITDATTGATIYYTTNGTTPTASSTKYTAAISVTASETIKAIAIATRSATSAVASAAYVIEKPAATPVFSVTAGTYAAKQSVTITDATSGAAIYYTTNGTTPTTASTKYSASISIAATETLEAIAIATGYINSAVASAKYTIVSPAATPTLSVAAGTYSSAQSVQIFDTTPGATIYYTTNGTAPTPASAVYKSAVSVSATGYLQAIAVADGYATSPIASALYSIGPNITATPVLSPPPGAYGKSQTVTITDATPGAVITYSVGIGSVVNTYTYTGPFTVSSTEYIAYDAIAPGYTRSAALEGIYTIGTVPTPQFSPAAGTYSTAQAVNIYDITPGATIYYTTDGTTPTTASAAYTGPIIVTTNQTIRAFAAASALTSSAPISSAYTIGKGVATPAFSLAPGSYTSTQSVAITDITPGATIYYTTNGAVPATSSIKYTGSISVGTTETLKAIAVTTGYTNSAVATGAYTIGYPIETFVVTSSGTNVLTIPVGGSTAFTVASENQGGQSYPSVTVKTSSPNPSLPVQVTLCQTNPSTGQCMSAPGPTVTLAPFAAGATPTFSVFITATAAIASSPSNEIVVLFTNASGTVMGSASVLVMTN